MARDNPDTGVVVRLAGDDRPWNPGHDRRADMG